MIYAVDSVIRYPAFEQPGPDEHKHCHCQQQTNNLQVYNECARIPVNCLISNREGLGTSLQIMGLATSQREYTEIHKIPKFGVNQASFH